MLTLRAITKQYGSTKALDDVSIDIAAGEVHALLGENGAGKSTLVKIAFGLVKPDGGTVECGGTLGMVHQHFTSIDSLTVAENIALAAGWPVRPKTMNAKAKELSERLRLPLDPTVLAGTLSAGLKQRLELLKALSSDARILLLDEPTSVLAPPEAEALLTLIGELRAKGIAVVLITHKLEEARRVADRVTVLRRGKVTLSGPVSEMNRQSLVKAIIGEDTDEPQMATDAKQMATDGSVKVVSAEPQMATDAKQMATDGSVKVVSAAGLSVSRIGETGSSLRSATFGLHAGEIVGVAAVEGSGQRELFRAIAGLVRPSGGTLQVNGRVAFVPEDRTSEGTVQEFTLAENLALVMGDEGPWVRGPWMHWDEAEKRMDELVEEFDVRVGGRGGRVGDPPNGGSNVPMATLSGGNQQKVIMAAALDRKPAVLLAENPTRGLDIKGSAAILGRLEQAARSGVAVLVHLPDLDDLLPLVDRVVVLNNGVLVEMPAGADRQAVGAAMVG